MKLVTLPFNHQESLWPNYRFSMSIAGVTKSKHHRRSYIAMVGARKLTVVRISVYNPATGDLVSDSIPVAGTEDIDNAVKYAKSAFAPSSPWRKMTGPERQAILLKFADLIEANQEKLAALTRVTLGAPYHPFGKSEIGTAITCFRCKCCLCM
jgi:acyl-CoA reductase-like NAD-dependent aldehyde dehydrogenase